MTMAKAQMNLKVSMIRLGIQFKIPLDMVEASEFQRVKRSPV